MTDQLRRPLVVGGLTLALGISVLDILNHALGEWGLYTVLASAIGLIFWRAQQRPQPQAVTVAPTIVNPAMVQRALGEAEQVLQQLETEVQSPKEPACIAVKPQIPLLQSQVTRINSELDRQEIRLIVMGAKGTGKTALNQILQTEWVEQAPRSITLWEAPSFFAGTAAGLNAENLALQQAMTADLVVFVVTGDLTESELQIIKRLVGWKRLVLAFNKQDQYALAERETVLNQLRQRVHGIVAPENVVAIAAVPNPIKVRQHQAEGEVKEWFEEQNPAIAPLTQRLNQILVQESDQLVLASSFGSAIVLKTQAKTVLNDVRRARAIPAVEQFQWIAAATAFASPVIAVDILATAAINAQMILDVSAIYQQKLSLQQAQKAAGILGSLMLKLGLVELSTQAIASLLKSNAVTYVAGGAIQGISAAYLTRIAGLSLIEYFHSQEPILTPTEAPPLAVEQFSQILQRVFQQNRQAAFLQTFVGQAIERLAPAFTQPTVPAPTPLVMPSSSTQTSQNPELLMPLNLKPQAAPELELLMPIESQSKVPLALTDFEPTSLSSP